MNRTVSVFDKDTGTYLHSGSEKSNKVQRLKLDGHFVYPVTNAGAPDFLRYDSLTGQIVPDLVRRQQYVDNLNNKKELKNNRIAASNFLVQAVNDPAFNWNSNAELKKVIRALAILNVIGIE